MLFNPIISKEKQAEISKLYEQSLENIGEAVVYMGKEAALKTSAMSGELFASNDDSILLNVPNALVRGAFAALDENGISLPEKDGKFNAHIVVFTPDEVQRIGGIEKVTERGKHFHYSISGIQEAQAANVFDFSRVWFMPVSSPELSQLRRTYGFDSSPGKHGFNIVVAMRKIGVLGHNQIKKVAASYRATGNVQGVGLRATLHDLLNNEKLPGLAVNNPHTGDVEIDLHLDNDKADDVINRLRKLLDSGRAGKENYQINKIEKANKLLDIVMNKKMIDRFAKRQGFTQLDAEPHDYKKQWLVKRYRLEHDGDNLFGKVAPMAYRQLKGLEPVYSIDAHLADGGVVPSTPWVDKARAKYKLKSAAEDILPGGEADNVPDSEFDKKKLEHGKKHEMEHTENPDIAKEVAKDHMLEDEDYYKKVEEIEKKSLASDALQHMLVHYSRKKLDELRPLTYEELTQDRTSGRWADRPDLAAKYVEDRRRFEKDLHKRLAAKGITTKPDTSFLYATLSGHERFGVPGQYKHEAELTPELINSSFFDVVGAGKSRTAFGQKGLLAALKKWKKAEKANALKEQEYMGMVIRPRIEVITTKEIKPIKAESNESEAD